MLVGAGFIPHELAQKGVIIHRKHDFGAYRPAKRLMEFRIRPNPEVS